MRNAFISALYELAKSDKQVIALVADIGAIVFDKYRADFPAQFVNFGISEANMISSAAGLASRGKIPFAYTIATFISMRPYEQIRDDVCLQNRNVKIVGVGGGIVYSTLGPTHHATEDIAIMRALPNMTVLSPADPLEAEKATFAAAKINGPVYLRLGTSKEPRVYGQDYDFRFGKGVVIKDGKDATIIATGSIVYDALQAANELEKAGLSTRLINIHTIKPIDKEIILKAANETKAILTVEEHNIEGGFGSAVADVIMEGNLHKPVKFKRLGIRDKFCSYYGSHQEVKAHCGISKGDIIREVQKLYEK